MVFSLRRRASPRALSAVAALGVNTSPMAAAPAAMLRVLLLKVPAWGMAFGRPGSYIAMISWEPPKAPKDIPPPMYFPSVVRSGSTS